MAHPKISRRELVAGTLALSALSALPLGAQTRSQGKQRVPKNIIFCVSDGMSMGVPALLEQYMQRVEGKKYSPWCKLLVDPSAHVGTMDTRSLNSLVTDSAAASSAWGSGSYVWNGMINMLPDGTKLRPILPILKEEAKMRTGLVTTATITHATPAGWAISTEGRGAESTIADLYLQAGLDVIMGGGKNFFNEELLAKFEAAGYELGTNREGMRSSSAGRYLGLFSGSHMPYEIDRKNNLKMVREVPSLAEMTQNAIARLAGSSEGFILQVEGARIDHAAHANDFAGLLFDQYAFEEALQIALDFAKHDGETLVVVTSDHGNSNPGLIGSGAGYGNSTTGLETAAKMDTSYEVLFPKLTVVASDADLIQIIEADLGLTISSDELSVAKMGRSAAGALSNIEQYSLASSSLSLALSNHTHICWSGRQHSSDWTLVTAYGPGSEAFGGHFRNTEIFGKLLATRKIEFKNPAMSWDEARKLKVANREVENHWTITA